MDAAQALPRVLDRLDAGREAALERLFTLMRIPSVSMDPAHAGDCARAAEVCVGLIADLGFSARAVPTASHPMVIGHRPAARPGLPHVLFYGHYDVQPVDPLDLWRRPPFEPYLAEHPEHGAMIVGRGASDDKGQVMTFIEACRAWLDVSGELPLGVSVLIEGDEESDSSHLPQFLTEHAEELKAGLVLVCDSGAWDRRTPAITTTLRGIASCELAIRGPSRDLHSGKYGGAAVNPIHVLSRVLGELHDGAGRVQVPGFYDGIAEPTREQRQHWQRLGFDPDDYLRKVGLKTPSGERGRSLLELIWARPTAEVNGVWGGYQGPGSKTVIPSEATAKLTFRLVPGQDPAAVARGFEAFVRARLHPDARAGFTWWDGTPAVGVGHEASWIARSAAALEAEWGRPPALIGSGGSIPIVSAFKGLLGMDALMIGFAQEDDNVHSPNEKYDVTSFHKGARSWARVLAALAAPEGTQV